MLVLAQKESILKTIIMICIKIHKNVVFLTSPGQISYISIKIIIHIYFNYRNVVTSPDMGPGGRDPIIHDLHLFCASHPSQFGYCFAAILHGEKNIAAVTRYAWPCSAKNKILKQTLET